MRILLPETTIDARMPPTPPVRVLHHPSCPHCDNGSCYFPPICPPIRRLSSSSVSERPCRICSPKVASIFYWILKATGFGFVIFSGVWGPLCYRETVENNELQDDLIQRIEDLTKVANLGRLERRMDQLALMKAWQFCEPRTEGDKAVEAWKDVISELDIDKMVRDLRATVTEVSSVVSGSGAVVVPTSTPTLEAPTTDKLDGGSVTERSNMDALVIILEIIFGFVAAFMLFLAVTSWRRKKRMTKHMEVKEIQE